MLGRRMAENRKTEGRLGDEDIAFHRLEGGAGGITLALVVAADHGPAALPFQHDLRRAEHMAGRHQGQRDAADG